MDWSPLKSKFASITPDLVRSNAVLLRMPKAADKIPRALIEGDRGTRAYLVYHDWNAGDGWKLSVGEFTMIA